MVANGMDPEPSWVKGYENGYDGPHISGQMRELSDELWGNNQEASIMLAEAAERIDDAHEEWMTERLLYGTPS